MFRRREDSLFDNTTDPNQASAESATVINPQSTPQSAQPASSSSSSSSNSNSSSPAYNSSTASSNPAARPAAASSTAAFRSPAAPIGADLARNRMPEAKTAMAGAMANPNAANADKNKSAPPRRVLTVGNDILLKGEIATCDRLVIEGKVDATLNDVHTVEIAENGSFKGSAHIEDAEISGLFEGDLVVRGRLVIYATGKVRGKITYGEIEIERGGELSGEIKTSTGAGAQAMVPRPPRQQKETKDAVAA